MISNAILITSPVAFTLDVALCGQETNTAVAVCLLSVALSLCRCKRVSYMCLLHRVHKLCRLYWRRMACLLLCKLRRVCGQPVTLKSFLHSAEAPLLLQKNSSCYNFPVKSKAHEHRKQGKHTGCDSIDSCLTVCDVWFTARLELCLL